MLVRSLIKGDAPESGAAGENAPVPAELLAATRKRYVLADERLVTESDVAVAGTASFTGVHVWPPLTDCWTT